MKALRGIPKQSCRVKAILTQTELCALLGGNPSQTVITLVKNLLQVRYPGLYSKLKCIQLNQEYIPNSNSHKRKWKAEDMATDLEERLVTEAKRLKEGTGAETSSNAEQCHGDENPRDGTRSKKIKH